MSNIQMNLKKSITIKKDIACVHAGTNSNTINPKVEMIITAPLTPRSITGARAARATG